VIRIAPAPWSLERAVKGYEMKWLRRFGWAIAAVAMVLGLAVYQDELVRLGWGIRNSILGSKVFDSLGELEIGMSTDIARYRKGFADNFYATDEELGKGSSQNDQAENWKLDLIVVGSAELASGHYAAAGKKSDLDFLHWSWGDAHKRVSVEFDKPGGLITSITCYDMDASGWCSLGGVSTGDSEEALISVFGRLYKSRFHNAVREVRYETSNVSFFLRKKQVYAIRTGISKIALFPNN
jgi:hypothetical protein